MNVTLSPSTFVILAANSSAVATGMLTARTPTAQNSLGTIARPPTRDGPTRPRFSLRHAARQAKNWGREPKPDQDDTCEDVEVAGARRPESAPTAVVQQKGRRTRARRPRWTSCSFREAD